MAEEDLTKEELIAEFDVRYQPKHATETKKNSKSTNVLIIVAVIALVCFVLFYGDIELTHSLEDWIGGEPEVIEPVPAEVELCRFSDLHSNVSVNIEIELTNLGETTAKDISIYVRASNQNGTTLYSGNLSLTVVLLREGENCSAVYSIPIDSGDTTVSHTIEVTWYEGRTSYHKETPL